MAFNSPAVHIVVDLISIEVWMVKNSLYQIFQLSSIGTVFTDMFLQNAFARGEDFGCIHIQWRQIFCRYSLLHSSGWNCHWWLHRNILQ